MQYREELSFLVWKARLCSIPTTHCDTFESSTKPSHIYIQFDAKAPDPGSCTTETKELRQYSWTLTNTVKLSDVTAVFRRNYSNILEFNSMVALQQLLWTKSWIGCGTTKTNRRNSTLTFSTLSMIFNWCSVSDKTTRQLVFQLSFRSSMWCFNQIRKISDVVELNGALIEHFLRIFERFISFKVLSSSLKCFIFSTFCFEGCFLGTIFIFNTA